VAGKDNAEATARLELPTSCDVLVAGAGVAGAATALLLARAGLSVLVVEARPRDHRPGFVLPIQRPGVALLADWGLLDALQRAGVPTLSQSAFCYGDRCTTIRSQPQHGVEGPLAVDQPLLDRVLRTAAERAGARFFDAHALKHVLRARGRVRGAAVVNAQREAIEISASWIVGADGVASTVAHLVGAPLQREGSYATSTIAAEFEGLECPGARWHFRSGLAGGAMGLRGNRTLAFVSASSRLYRERLRRDLAASLYDGIEQLSRSLGGQLASAHRVGTFFGGSEHVAYARRPVGPGWLLVGDAGAFTDPIVGHGLTAALRDAHLAAAAICEGSTTAFAEARDAMDDEIAAIGERIASFRWSLDELPLLHLRLADALRRQARWLAPEDDFPLQSDPKTTQDSTAA